MATNRWSFTGDVNLEYGGVFIDLSTWNDGYCSAVRVTDLDSGCGFRGACLIEHVVINGTDSPKRLREAMRSCGCSAEGMSKEGARLMLAEALMSYGYTDPDSCYGFGSRPDSETIQCEQDGPMSCDGWKADKRLNNTTLRAYVESVHLD